jgi:hypothetical protein
MRASRVHTRCELLFINDTVGECVNQAFNPVL